jgi:hypothetical protein
MKKLWSIEQVCEIYEDEISNSEISLFFSDRTPP